jgi:hypothetical protein
LQNENKQVAKVRTSFGESTDVKLVDDLAHLERVLLAVEGLGVVLAGVASDGIFATHVLVDIGRDVVDHAVDNDPAVVDFVVLGNFLSRIVLELKKTIENKKSTQQASWQYVKLHAYTVNPASVDFLLSRVKHFGRHRRTGVGFFGDGAADEREAKAMPMRQAQRQQRLQ